MTARCMIIFLSAVLCLASGAAHAAHAPQKKDFTHALPLRPSAPGVLNRVELPEVVFSGLTREDMGDLAVFDESGTPLPFLVAPLERPEPVIAEKKISFTFYEVRMTGIEARDMRFPGQPKADPENKPDVSQRDALPLSYVAEIPDEPLAAHGKDRNTGFTRLDIVWSGEDRANPTYPVRIMTGNDLTAWKPLIPAVMLANLNRAARQEPPKEQNAESGGDKKKDAPAAICSLELPRNVALGKYILIQRTDNASMPKTLSVTGIMRTLEQAAPIPPKPRLAAGRKVNARDTTWEYDIQGMFPAYAASLKLPEGTVIKNVCFYSRAATTEKWTMRGCTETLFNVPGIAARPARHDGAPENSASVRGMRHRFWQVRTPTPVSDDVVPELKLYWSPQVLYFLAPKQGNAILAYGADNAPDQLAGALLETQGDTRTLPQAYLSEMHKGLAHAPSETPFDWQTWVLWAVLIIGAVTLTAMGISALKKKNN